MARSSIGRLMPATTSTQPASASLLQQFDGVPPGVNPQGAALKLTLAGGDRAYEFNINLD